MGDMEYSDNYEKLRADIKSALLKQMKQNKTNSIQYTDIITDYMELWDIKNMLIKDIKTRGVSIYWKNGENQEGFKRNESISELAKVNSQMLKILAELKLKAADSAKAGGRNRNV